MTFARITIAACLWAAGGLTASGQDGKPGVVLELYSSQGCSSCPSADVVFARMAEEPGVIALSLHVDYWDYIGWVDSFADPRFTERQKAYARAEGSRTIYTPQMIVGGRDRIEGTDPEAVAASVRAHQAVPQALDLDVTRQGDRLTILAAPPAEPPRGMIRVQLVRYLPHAQVMIEAGENAGMMVDYTNVVTSWQLLQDWDGRAPLDIVAPVTGDEPTVVILQAEGPGPILAAARSQ